MYTVNLKKTKNLANYYSSN